MNNQQTQYIEKSTFSWMVTMIVSSTEPMWATYAILNTNRVTDPLIAYTSVAEG